MGSMDLTGKTKEELIREIELLRSLESDKLDKISIQSSKLNAILDSSQHIVWSVDKRLKTISFNQNYYESPLLRYSPTAPILYESDGLMKSLPAEEFWRLHFGSCFEGSKQKLIIKISPKDIGDIWYDIYLNPIYDHDGEIVEAASIAHNTTDRIQANLDLQAANEELIEARDIAQNSLMIKERFLANLSHEIRTPLNGILGILHLFNEKNLDKEQKEQIHTLKKSYQILLHILNDILDLSKIEAGKTELKKGPIQMDRLISNVCGLYSSNAAMKSIALSCHQKENVPEYILGDETKLTQILSNLVSNAIKFAYEEGEVKVTAEAIDKKKDRATLKITVEDNGIGISKEDQGLLFQSFSQIDSSMSKSFTGTGLGLAISKSLINLMGGEIGVDSAPDQGAKFWIEFEAKVIAKPEGLDYNSDKENVKLKNRPKILVVDDNRVNLKVASKILSQSGAEVMQAKQAEQAISLSNEHQFDLIVMDIQMPKINGIEATQRIRANKKYKHTPVIALTAYATAAEQNKILKSGLTDYIVKPYAPHTLINKIADILEPNASKEQEERTTNGKKMVINTATVERLAEHGDWEMIHEAFDEFTKETKEQITHIQDFIKKGTPEKSLHHLHTIKGNAGTLGLEILTFQAELLENYLLKSEFESFEERFADLITAYDDYKYQISLYLN